jgi:hypothetical protein
LNSKHNKSKKWI